METFSTKSCVRYPEMLFNNNKKDSLNCIELVQIINGGSVNLRHSYESNNNINNNLYLIGNNISLNNSFNTINNMNTSNSNQNSTNIFNFDRVFPEDTDQHEVINLKNKVKIIFPFFLTLIRIYFIIWYNFLFY